MLGQPSLLEHGICCMARFDFTIYWETYFCDRAEPDFVVTFTLPLEAALVGAQ